MKTNRPIPLPRRLLFPLAFLLLFSTASAGIRDFYAYPPTDRFPDLEGKSFFLWPNNDTDPHDRPDALGLRDLNEDVAGEHGQIRQEGARFVRGDGEPIRFWGVNVTGAEGFDRAAEQAPFLAKRGVNLVRVHGGASKSLFSPTADSLAAVNDAVIEQMHDVVSAMKQSGIYTYVSNTFFIINLELKASHGVAGYTADWLAANPDQRTPYGLLFLDDTMRSAYRTWLTELMTRPNPNEPDRRPLAEDPAVAVVELVNEDNLFFNTFDPADWPPEQQRIQERRFYQWVGERYLDPDDPEDTVAKAATRALEEHWFGRRLTRDDLEAGRLQLVSALSMSQNRGSALFRNRDQVAYLAEQQRGFFAEMKALLSDLGYDGVVSANNWKTINTQRLGDLELYTYTAGDLIDRHNFYSPWIREQAQFFAVAPGDRFFPVSAFLAPRGTPLQQKQVADHPFSISEQAWTMYTPLQGEAPLAVASYMSMLDVDAWMWFAIDTKTWNTGGHRTWIVENPATLGQFPAAALLYRRGDIAEAGVVGREGRTPASLTSLEESKLVINTGFDVFRDDPGDFDPDPVPGRDLVDPAIGLVGKTVLDPSTDEDLFLPEALDRIGGSDGTIRSMTGQLRMNTDAGVLVLDSGRSQGANGFLGSHGPVETENLRIDMGNDFGAVVVTSLDGNPLVSAESLFIQAFASNRRVGFSTEPVEMSWRSESVTGLQVLDPGEARYEVERLDVRVRLKGFADRWESARRLDVNLYPDGTIEAGIEGDDVVLTLPSDSLYTKVDLRTPEEAVARIETRMLPNARLDTPYEARLQAAGAAGTWHLADASGALPAGLALGEDGTLAGTPGQGGLFQLRVELQDGGPGEAVLDTRAITLLVEPVPATTPWGTPANQPKDAFFGWVLDLEWPMVWSWEFATWLYVVPSDSPAALFAYRYEGSPGGWTWLSREFWPWYYDYETGEWKSATPL